MSKLDRRDLLNSLGATCATTVIASQALAAAMSPRQPVRLGMIADLHGGLAVDAMARLDTFLSAMQKQPCHALVQMGDFAYPNAKHQPFADKFNAAHEQRIHVIGNHEFDHGLGRTDCYSAWGIQASFYRRDVQGLRLLVLDGNDTGSPTHRGGYPSFIGDRQKQWLDRELRSSDRPVLILSHQPRAGTSAINNAKEIQSLLAKHRSKVVACFNGHSHVDSLVQIDGVSYLHLNSASYFWVGGKTRMAYYSKSLFTTVTIDPESASLRVEASHAEWKEQSPKELGYFESKNRPPESIVTPQIRGRKITTARSQ